MSTPPDTFTYDLTTSIGLVRLEIQDTDSEAPLLYDEEIQVAIDAESGTNVLGWAARCCEMIARGYAQKFGFKSDTTQIDFVERTKTYLAMAAALRKRASGKTSGYVQTVHADGWNANRQVPPDRVTLPLPDPEALRW